jgi:plasmid stability protein
VTSLLIRHVDDVLHMRLKASAAAHRCSLEEEARELLRAAVARQHHTMDFADCGVPFINPWTTGGA